MLVVLQSLGDTAQAEEEEEFYKLLPANKADQLCQLWQTWLVLQFALGDVKFSQSQHITFLLMLCLM